MFNQMQRDLGDQILQVENLTKIVNGEVLFKNISFTINNGDKVALLSQNSLATSALHDILAGRDKDFKGEFKWGVTVVPSSLPIDNHDYFEGKDDNLVDWLREYSKDEKDETFIRSFLGRMLFSGEEVFKKSSVLSGGEKMRCMFSKMMLEGPNVLLMDEPTNHLDLESITALNNGLKDFKGVILLTSRDHELTETVANRVIEITPKGALDKLMDYDDYITNETIKQQRIELYGELV
jgi:ATPase subunit of ABC transporter with duplicated ATPase domains